MLLNAHYIAGLVETGLQYVNCKNSKYIATTHKARIKFNGENRIMKLALLKFASVATLLYFGSIASAETTTIFTQDGLSMSQCKRMIAGMSDNLGVKPITIVDTDLACLVKLFGRDGEYLFTCSALDRKLVVTLSN